jgi:hypothetical protein
MIVHRTKRIESDSQTFETPKGRELLKEPVVCWTTVADKSSNQLLTKPLVAPVNHDGPPAFEVGTPLPDDADVIDTTPAAEGTMRVTANFPQSDPETPVVIGIEYPNGTIPDWDDVIDAIDESGSWKQKREVR